MTGALGTFDASWERRPLWTLYERVKNVDHPDELLLSVSRERGVVAKESLEGGTIGVESNSIYQLVHDGWLVVNRMQAWRGAVGVSTLSGIVSGHYICFRPKSRELVPRFAHYLLRSAPYVAEYAAAAPATSSGASSVLHVARARSGWRE